MSIRNPTIREQLGQAVFLCLVAGYLDGYGLLVLGTFVSFMSGNSTSAGVSVGQGQPQEAAASAVAILCFVVGSTLGALTVRSRLPRAHRWSCLLIAMLIAIVSILGRVSPVHSITAVGLLALGAGIVNPLHSKVGASSVSLTFMTGNLNRLGTELASAIYGDSLVDSAVANDTPLRRAGLELAVWLSFVSGAILAGALASHLRHWTLIPPMITMLVLSIID